jgi:predicted transcriptional regulator|tara:strand:- start:1635 stop:1904 length:270 start_codon:yes stop_codon:yes gene_type:complete
MVLNYDNYKAVGKKITKDLGLSRRTVELYQSCLFWALQKNSLKETVGVSGRTISLLSDLERNGLIKTTNVGRKYMGAELLTDFELTYSK